MDESAQQSSQARSSTMSSVSICSLMDDRSSRISSLYRSGGRLDGSALEGIGGRAQTRRQAMNQILWRSLKVSRRLRRVQRLQTIALRQVGHRQHLLDTTTRTVIYSLSCLLLSICSVSLEFSPPFNSARPCSLPQPSPEMDLLSESMQGRLLFAIPKKGMFVKPIART